MNKEKQKAVAFTLFFVWSFFPSFIYPMLTNDYSSTETMPFYSRFFWGVSVYIIGAILYSFRYEITLKKSLVWFICIVLIQVGYIVLTELNIIKLFGSSAVYFWPPNSVSSILIAILLVLIFSKVKIKRNCIVNYIASCSLGIYMLHDGYLQLIFWQDIFKMNEKGTSEFFLSYLLVTIVTVFLAGIIIDTMWKGCWKGLYVIKQIGNKKM